MLYASHPVNIMINNRLYLNMFSTVLFFTSNSLSMYNLEHTLR